MVKVGRVSDQPSNSLKSRKLRLQIEKYVSKIEFLSNFSLWFCGGSNSIEIVSFIETFVRTKSGINRHQICGRRCLKTLKRNWDLGNIKSSIFKHANLNYCLLPQSMKDIFFFFQIASGWI